MRLVGRLATYLARLLAAIRSVFDRAAFIVNGFLPALLPPRDLTHLIRAHYERSYIDTYARFSNDLYEWTLEAWEEDVLLRHGIRSGNILVLGAGVGRESIALAQQGLSVVGLDINREAVRTADCAAQRTKVSAAFVQADFLALPIRPHYFDYVLLSGIMYSSISGRAHRQAWLKSLHAYLKDGGCIVLNFLVDRWPPTRSRRLVEAVNRLAVTLPGANKSYQPGDTCAQGHFLHAFQSEDEIRQEFLEADVLVTDLAWRRGFAVVRFPP